MKYFRHKDIFYCIPPGANLNSNFIKLQISYILLKKLGIMKIPVTDSFQVFDVMDQQVISTLFVKAQLAKY
jgi:hypothetical protein